MPFDEKSPVFLPVKDAYDRWSTGYDSYENPMVFFATEALGRGLAGRIAGKSVFEFGCGTGRNLAALAAAGANPVRGCDLSEGMLSIARSKVPRADLFRHDFAQPLPDGLGEVDVALFSLTLEHADGLEHPLREARRILAPGGTVWIFEIHPFLSLSGVAAHFHDEGQEVRMPTYPHQFSNYLQAIASAGLRVVECREWRARDLDVPVPVKAVKRGPDFPMLVEFRLSTA